MSATIDEKSKIGILQAVSACIGIVGIVLWQQSQFSGIKDRFNSTDLQFVTVQGRLGRIEEVLSDRLTRSEFASWVDLFRAENASQKIPEFRK